MEFKGNVDRSEDEGKWVKSLIKWGDWGLVQDVGEVQCAALIGNCLTSDTDEAFGSTQFRKGKSRTSKLGQGRLISG